MTNFQKRIKEYANPSHSEWRGQSTEANLKTWGDRASEESKLAPRAKSGSVELPTTGPVRTHDTNEKAGYTGDFYAEAKRDLNRDLNNPYQRGVRRIT
jgi:hypothetical protein